MGADEAGTVRDLKAHQAVVLPMITEHGGRIIDTAGDGILAEFSSIANAVECAVAIQRTMAQRNAGVEETRRIHFRIGIRCHVVLKLEDILKRAIEAISPEMGACGCIKQLRGNADAVSNPANRAFQHIQDAKLFADLFHVHCSILVGEARISGDHEELADVRQRGDDLLHHAIGEVFLLRIAAHVRKWKHGNGGFVGESKGWFYAYLRNGELFI
jgi:hypothetical protein